MMEMETHRTPDPFKSIDNAYIQADEDFLTIISLDGINIGNVDYTRIMARIENEIGTKYIEAKMVNLFVDRFNNLIITGKRDINSMEFRFTYRYTTNYVILEPAQDGV